MSKPLFRLLTELSSRRWISKTAGAFAKSGLSRRMIRSFARSYGIRLEDAEKPPEQYATLNEFFTRRLKPGLRPLDADETALVSPVDALITGTGPIRDGVMLNVKGQDYTIDELLNGSPRTVNYMNGYYYVLYLSPTDYHRIHAPAQGTLVETEHIRGKVYPVNDFGLKHMRRVLSRNERVVTYLGTAYGELAVVKVGALNVSSIKYVEELGDTVERGDELAYFEFGSTVVLLIENGIYKPDPRAALGTKVQMGSRLGLLQHKGGHS